MDHGPTRRLRQSIRLKGYDYSRAGAYFITICAQGRECLFGEFTDGNIRLTDGGQMVLGEWNAIPDRFPSVELDAFVVMPNHVHGIIVLTIDTTTTGDDRSTVGADLVPDLPATLVDRSAGLDEDASAGTIHDPTVRATTRVATTVGAVVGAFKSSATVLYIRGVKQLGWPRFRGRLWQQNYYEHIIRDEADLNDIREYIVSNPARWPLDRENPALTIDYGPDTWQT